jgi:hypothetical protein
LHPQHVILSLDEQGSILWFLSGLLNVTLPVCRRRYKNAELRSGFDKMALAFLETSGGIEVLPNTYLQGHKVGDIIDSVYLGLEGDDSEHRSAAILVLLAIITPFGIMDNAVMSIG